MLQKNPYYQNIAESSSEKESLNSVDYVIDSFNKHFSNLGYEQIESVKISSGIDPTVRFIGSHISVFKHLFMNSELPENGIFMNQDCIRTHNIKKPIDDSAEIKWGSHFPSLGSMVRYEKLNQIILDTVDFLTNELRVSKSELKILLSSKDADLFNALQDSLQNEITVELDSKPLNYYRHKLGIEGVFGRNFNIAIKNKETGIFADVGNIIVVEDKEKKLGVELALGVTTILKELNNLSHIMDNYPIKISDDLENFDEISSRKLEDSIVVATTLFREGLRPFGSDNRNRILKTYLKSMLYHKLNLGLTDEDLLEKMENFEIKYYKLSSKEECFSKLIVEYLATYLNEIKFKQNLSKEDLKILNLLNH